MEYFVGLWRVSSREAGSTIRLALIWLSLWRWMWCDNNSDEADEMCSSKRSSSSSNSCSLRDHLFRPTVRHSSPGLHSQPAASHNLEFEGEASVAEALGALAVEVVPALWILPGGLPTQRVGEAGVVLGVAQVPSRSGLLVVQLLELLVVLGRAVEVELLRREVERQVEHFRAIALTVACGATDVETVEQMS